MIGEKVTKTLVATLLYDPLVLIAGSKHYRVISKEADEVV